jgi:general secretion pathway protein B
MSYILDALKKAAEQRGESTPGFRRLVTSPPAPADGGRAWARGGILVACVVAAGAIAVVALRPVSVAVTVVAPRSAEVVPPAPAQAPRAAVPAPRAAVSPPPAAAPRAPIAAPPAPRVVAPLVSIPAVAPPSRPTPAARPPVVASAPRTERVLGPTPMPTAPPIAATEPHGDPKLKLEVLVYSDVVSERMVFINGRKYVQGDTVAERARVEEIQADGVVLSEQGRRFTLRQQ